VFQCKDIRALWDNDVPRQCWDMPVLQSLSYTNIAFNITTDMLFALVIPIPMLWKLRVPARTRAALVCVLALGLFACVAALVKVTYIVNYGKVGDFLWDSRDITIWTVTESNVGIVAGSIPPLRPLLKNVFGGVYGYGTGSKKTSGTPGYYAKGSRAGGAGKDWQALSSAQRANGGKRVQGEYDIGDDSSSERAINTATGGGEAFEMGFRRSPSAAVRTIITSKANMSDDSLDKAMMATTGLAVGGITKITETTVAVTEQRRE
jgi:rhodopsin domain-containing protein